MAASTAVPKIPVAKKGPSLATMEGLIKAGAKSQFDKFLESPDTELIDPITQRNILHVICESGHFEFLKSVFAKRPQDVCLMARSAYQPKDKNTPSEQTPFDCLKENGALGQAEKERMLKLLEGLTLSTTTKPAHELLDEADCKQSANDLGSTARWLINEVRKLKIIPTTHPTTKFADFKEFSTMNSQYQKLRAERRHLYNGDEGHDAEVVYHSLMDVSGNERVGNCNEDVDCAKHLLKAKDPKAYSQAFSYHFVPGDHVILMLGIKEHNYVPKPDFSNWHDTEFCDPLYGVHGVGSQLASYVGSFRGYWSHISNKFICIQTPYNPSVHRIEAIYEPIAKPVVVEEERVVLSDNGAWHLNNRDRLFVASSVPLKPTPLPIVDDVDDQASPSASPAR